MIESDGTRHAYSARHLGDDWGFLSEATVDDFIEELSVLTREEFLAAWEAE